MYLDTDTMIVFLQWSLFALPQYILHENIKMWLEFRFSALIKEMGTSLLTPHILDIHCSNCCLQTGAPELCLGTPATTETISSHRLSLWRTQLNNPLLYCSGHITSVTCYFLLLKKKLFLFFACRKQSKLEANSLFVCTNVAK